MRTRIVTAIACMVAVAGLAVAQKPKSKKEVEAVMAVQSATTADTRIAAVENLIQNFADTEFKSWALTQAARAAQSKGDSAKAMVYAEQAMKADPKAYEAKLLVANELAAHTREFDLDKGDKLSRADKLAKEGIEEAGKAPKPNAQVPDAQWEAVKKDNIADGHRVLGMIASVDKKWDVAINEYKMSVDEAADPDPADRVRLATSYIEGGKLDEGLAEIAKVMADPKAVPAVKKFAQNEQARAEKMKAGAK